MTTEEANRFVGARKTIDEPIVWVPRHQRLLRSGFRVLVRCTDVEQSLWLAGTASPSKWSFVLLGPGNETLRKISTPHTGHINPDGTIAAPFHKHYWTEQDEGRATYVPDDIRWDSCNTALADFVVECNIVVMRDLPTLSFQSAFS